jgi:hypothetical protein
MVSAALADAIVDELTATAIIFPSPQNDDYFRGGLTTIIARQGYNYRWLLTIGILSMILDEGH